VGGDSPPVRQQVQETLTAKLGVRGRTIAGVGHPVHLDAPERFAALLREAAG
jgi:pimeloyl-ACP methyl ester carboxylesterase